MNPLRFYILRKRFEVHTELVAIVSDHDECSRVAIGCESKTVKHHPD
jgi:hypothetical protein